MTRFSFITVAAMAAACADSPATSPDRPALANTHGEALLVSDPTDSQSWVALLPGAFPNATTARVYNASSGAVHDLSMIAGRLDPRPVPADVGDTLIVSVRIDSATAVMAVPVPRTKPPVIVRTEPPPRRLDVPLNVIMQVVFSEPMDPASIHSGTVQLYARGVPVQALVQLDTSLTVATVTPAMPLERDVDYALVVRDEARDLSGESLSEPHTSPFSTGIGRISYAHAGRIWLLDPLAPAPVPITPDTSGSILGYDWSPDHSRIVYSLQHVQHGFLFVMDADGSNRVAVLGGVGPDHESFRNPQWSPDGSLVAFDHFVPGDSGWGVSLLEAADPRGSVRRVTDGHHDDHLSDWHPDATTLGITRSVPGASGTPGALDAVTGEVRPVPGAERAVMGGTGPVWNDDGTLVVVQELEEGEPPRQPARPRILRPEGTTASVGPVGTRMVGWVGSSLWMANPSGLVRLVHPDFEAIPVWAGPQLWDWALGPANEGWLVLLTEIPGGSELRLLGAGTVNASLLISLEGNLPTGLRWIR